MSQASRSPAGLERAREELERLREELDAANRSLGAALLAHVESGGGLDFVSASERVRRAGAEGGLSGMSAGAKKTLRELGRRLGVPSQMGSSEQARQELAILRTATSEPSLEQWDDLPREAQLALSHVIVARARAFQEVRPEYIEWCDARDEVAELFSRVKPRASRAGFIHGLAVSHEPRHGDDWYADAAKWSRELENLSGGEGVEGEDEDLDETIQGAPGPNWAWWPVVMGKRVALFGGESTPVQERRLATALAAQEVESYEEDELDELLDRISEDELDVVVMLKGFEDEEIATCAHQSGVVEFVARSADVEDVRAAIEREVPQP